MENQPPEYVTGEAIYSLAKKLKLPSPDIYGQDWEYIVADSTRIDEFIAFYSNSPLSIEGKFALMIVIISSYDDAIQEKSNNKCTWDKIRYYLLRDYNIHANTILYWSVIENENIEDCFAITPFIRELLIRIKI
jgi:hypothetical protein